MVQADISKGDTLHPDQSNQGRMKYSAVLFINVLIVLGIDFFVVILLTWLVVTDFICVSATFFGPVSRLNHRQKENFFSLSELGRARIKQMAVLLLDA